MRLAPALAALLAVAAAPLAAQPDLTTGEWNILEIGGKRPRSPATINFTRARWLGLNTNCGAAWGWYRRSGEDLRIHVTGRGRHQGPTASPCQGIDYRLLLGRVRTFGHQSDQLMLFGDGGAPVARLALKK
jgi:hypothetical protein